MTGTHRVSTQSPSFPLRTLQAPSAGGFPLPGFAAKKKGRAQRGPSANSLSPSPFFNIFANHRPFCIPCDILKPSNTRHLHLHPHTPERFTDSGAEDSANARHRSWTPAPPVNSHAEASHRCCTIGNLPFLTQPPIAVASRPTGSQVQL